MISINKQINFNRPFITGKEIIYIQEVLNGGLISSEGEFIRKCQDYFEKRYQSGKALFTSSCTSALEMAALLLDIGPGDEVIVPAYTFTSTANAFLIRGAKIVFADSRSDNPNIDEKSVEALISPKTKLIVPVHYAGVACNMEELMRIAERNGVKLVEDAAQGVNAFYKDKVLGSMGQIGCYSFHNTKNITSGEGGLILINDASLGKKAEQVYHKGTNRIAFNRGEISKYEWVNKGSSYTTSELNAACLWAQLEDLEIIQERRGKIWKYYYQSLKPLEEQGYLRLNDVPEFARHNYHIFYLLLKNENERLQLATHLKNKGIAAYSHYHALHNSQYFKTFYKGSQLDNAEYYEKCLLRLPLYSGLQEEDAAYVSSVIASFFR